MIQIKGLTLIKSFFVQPVGGNKLSCKAWMEPVLVLICILDTKQIRLQTQQKNIHNT